MLRGIEGVVNPLGGAVKKADDLLGVIEGPSKQLGALISGVMRRLRIDEAKLKEPTEGELNQIMRDVLDAGENLGPINSGVKGRREA